MQPRFESGQVIDDLTNIVLHRYKLLTNDVNSIHRLSYSYKEFKTKMYRRSKRCNSVLRMNGRMFYVPFNALLAYSILAPKGQKEG